jgi:hypothetical protein
MKNWLILGGVVGSLAILALVLGNGNTLGGTSIIMASQGGTGTSTKPTAGQVLMGNASGTYSVVATSSLGFNGMIGLDKNIIVTDKTLLSTCTISFTSGIMTTTTCP